MMMDNPQTPQSDPEDQQDNGQDEQQESPLSGPISRVKAYLKNPSMVNKDTLTELLTELEDVDSYLSDEEAPEDQAGSNSPMGQKLSGMLNRQGGSQ